MTVILSTAPLLDDSQNGTRDAHGDPVTHLARQSQNRMRVENTRQKNSPDYGATFPLYFKGLLGAGNQVRTGDLNLGKVALYQLSYSREGPRF